MWRAHPPARGVAAPRPTGTARTSRRIPRSVVWPASVLLLAIVMYALRRPLLTEVAELTVVDDPRAPSEYLFLLNGDVEVRAFYTAELYRQGMAPRILLSAVEVVPTERLGLTLSQTDLTLAVLGRLGVPDTAIVVIPFDGGATSTRDEAKALRRFLESRPARRVTVVTTAHHSGRARYTLRREMEGLPVEIRVAAAPDRGFSPSNWWQSERGIAAYVLEYMKWIHTLAD